MRPGAVSRRLIFLTTLMSIPLLAAGTVSGTLEHRVDGGLVNLTFAAQSTGNSGEGSGKLTFAAPLALSGTDEDDPYAATGHSELILQADISCVVVFDTRALMSGIVRDANVVGYSGRRLVLVVEDGGTGTADKFTWAIYRTPHIKWFPTDAEREYDEGAGAVWFTSDAERDDDEERLTGREHGESDCRAFQLSTYDLIDVSPGSGAVTVVP